MKKGLVICGPDVAHGPLALLSGTFEEKVSKAAALGYDGVELMVRDPAKLDWRAVKGCLQASGLETPQIVTGELWGEDRLCFATSDPEVHSRAVERMQAVIDLAAHLGAMVNVGRVRGRLDFLGEVENSWKTALERFRPVVEFAGSKGVRICLEPLNRYESDFILKVEDGLRFIHDLGAPNLGLMVDTFHMNIEEDSIEAALQQAGEKLWHVHIADSQRCYPGSGHLAFAPVFETLRKMDYRGYVSAELLPVPDPDTAGRKTIEFLIECAEFH